MPHGFNNNKTKAEIQTIKANPTASASETLSKLQVGNDVYKVGGTEVIPNPKETYSRVLDRIKIDDVVYLISPRTQLIKKTFEYDVSGNAREFESFSFDYEEMHDGDYTFVVTGVGCYYLDADSQLTCNIDTFAIDNYSSSVVNGGMWIKNNTSSSKHVYVTVKLFGYWDYSAY